ncbi:peroxidase family protein [Siccirubricoccus sp. G192]|uniref:peroxidase family protein n=1 Tax=Siccirubricoccus sp. G192 TaxID=2849651 RepID=UPI001C2C02E6|nr:peroxidase family protein [Siccirubricoccus sp. G192]MBV1796785.1 M10 family metallopeptidase C-terminal domain-containing protein [Siccirubricoccus sp. G192]
MEFRSIDGSGNNLAQTGFNAAGSAFIRLAPARYADGIASLAEGPEPRSISNLVAGQGDAAVANAQGLSGMMYAWGQFIDHDLTRTPSDGVTRIDIAVPEGDPAFPEGTILPLTRAVIDPASGGDAAHPAVAINRVTGWLDASMVYGSDAATAAALRLPDGRMAVSAGDNLPVLEGGVFAGDLRAGENPSLTALQVLFLREHNFQVERLHAADPGLDAEALYQQARAIVGAEIAHITYDEFLPHLLGPGALAPYAGYDAAADPRLLLEFAGAAYRWGHSTVSAETERLDEAGNVAGPELELRDVFFMPPEDFAGDGGADGFLRHLGADLAQAMDARIVEDLRNFLFDPPVGQDLAAINIQRGRDLGLPTLNQMRAVLGLDPYADFAEITADAGTIAGLRAAYGSVDAIDLWTGGLSEALLPGSFLGETFGSILARQFTALRDGDRLWYQNQGFDAATLAEIEQTSLSDIIRRNTDTAYLQEDVFVYFERHPADVTPEHPGLPQLVVGTGGGQYLAGGKAGDILAGGAGDQMLLGKAGADTILGGEGADLLRGGAGADTLVGGAGQDTLVGGAGADLFRFTAIGDSTPGSPDLIRDFTPGEDRIDLSAIDTDPVRPGDQGFAWLGLGRFSATGQAEARVQGRGAEKTLLMLDLDGDGAVDMVVALRNAVPREEDLLL